VTASDYTFNSLATIDGTNFLVSGGGRLSLPAATSYTHTHRSNSVHLRASGTGSLLDLGAVELVIGANGTAERLLIEALEGGTVDLSGVTQILDPEEGDLRGRAVRITADGADSRVDLASLEVMHDRSSAFWSNITGYSSLTATNGGEIAAPSLTTLNAVEINLDGTGILPVGQITTLTNSQLTVTASDYTFNSLATIDGTNFLVSGGGRLSLPAATSYTHTHRSNSVHFRASGTGSLLDLGGVELVIGPNGAAEHLIIEALEGGTIDLSGLNEILDPEEGDQRGRAVRISADGADSRVDLANLEVLHDRSSAFWSSVTGYSSLTATNGGEIAAPSLTTLNAVEINLDGTGILPVGQITTLTNSRLIVSAEDYTFNSLATIDGSSFLVSGGGSLSLPAATSYTHTHRSNSVHFRASGTGSLLDLGGVELVIGPNGAAEHLIIEALEGGTIDLSGLNEIIDPDEGDQRGRAVRITSDGSGSRVDLGSLFRFQNRSTANWSNVSGTSEVIASNGGEIILNFAGILENVIVHEDDESQIVPPQDALQVHLLPLDTPRVGHLSANGQSVFYRMDVSSDQVLQIDLDHSDQGHRTEIHARQGRLPLRSIHDFQFMSTATDQTMRFPTGTGGTWFILVFASQTPADHDFTIMASESPMPPRVVGYTLDKTAIGTAESILIHFDRPMDTDSYSAEDDIVSFTGPQGTLFATGHAWVDSQTLSIPFDGSVRGDYRLELGPDIRSETGIALDQNGNLIPSETPGDHYAVDFFVSGMAHIIDHSPREFIPMVHSGLRLHFDRPMDTSSFTISSSIVSFSGPQGTVVPSSFTWIDSQTLEIQITETVPGDYQLVLSPSIRDAEGNPLDQNDNHIAGETPGDQYVADFRVSEIVTGTLQADTTWTTAHGTVQVDGVLTVPEGVTLTIEPGVVVKFSPGARLIVNGRLEAHGTAASRVLFTSLRDDASTGGTGENGTPPQRGDWYGINVRNGQINLSQFEVRYATIAIDANFRNAKAVLASGVLRDNSQYGIYSWAPFAEVHASNLLIANNSAEGIFVRADSRHIVRNSTIVGNGRGIHIGGASLTLDNTIVAFNGQGLNHHGDPPHLVVRNSLFFNPVGGNIGWGSQHPGRPDLEANGNMIADPRFVNRAVGNYELAAGSPAIDSGRSTGAPQTDILGRPRYDDRGMANRGFGFPSYIDIGAFERQVDTSAVDFAVTQVSFSGSTATTSAEDITVQWTVVNRGNYDAAGSWRDAVYLSPTPFLTQDSVLLGTPVRKTGLIAPGESYTAQLTASLTDLSGPYYVLVQANVDKDIVEPVTSNNLAVSQRVLAVDVPQLPPPGVTPPITHFVVGNNQWRYYRYHPESARNLVVELGASDGNWELYVRRGAPPTAHEYDAVSRSEVEGSYSLRLLEPTEETYFIGVRRVQGTSDNFSLSVTHPEFSVRDVSPRTIGIGGAVTLKVTGDEFTPDTNVHLVGFDGSTIDGAVRVKDSTTLLVTFELSHDVASGEYDLIVTSASDSITVAAGIVLTNVEQRTFQAQLQLPNGMTRPGRSTTVAVTFTNTGNVDIPSPILRLAGDGLDFAWRLPGQTEWVEGPEIRFLAVGEGVPPILRPGQIETISIEMRTPFRQGPYRVQLFSFGAPSETGEVREVDWGAIYDRHWPAGVSPETWESVFPQVTAQLGLNWTDYATALGRSFTRWQSAGAYVVHAQPLIQMQVNEALGLPSGILTGRIVSSSDGLPVANTFFEVKSGASAQTVIGQTDDQGRFAVYGLSPGKVALSIPNYVVAFPNELVFPEQDDSMALDIAVLQGGRLFGQILDADTNQPISNATVVVRSSSDFSAGAVTSDGGGRFDVGSLVDGHYWIEVRADNYQPRRSDSIELSATGPRSIVYQDMLLMQGVRRQITVRDTASGLAIQDAQVLIANVADNSMASLQLTDSDGQATFDDIGPGEYSITVRAPGYSASILTHDLESDTGTFEVELSRVSSLTGRVVDQNGNPLGGVVLSIDSQTGLTEQMVSSSEGGFTFEGIDSKEVVLSALSANVPIWIKTVDLTDSGDVVDVTLPVAARIVGAVVNRDNEFVTNGELFLTDEDGSVLHTAELESDGTFELLLLRTGRYVVYAVTTEGVSSGFEVNVSGDTGSAFDVQLRLGDHSVIGHLADANGQSVANQFVHLRNEVGVVVAEAATDESGAFHFVGLGSGKYSVVSARDGELWSQELLISDNSLDIGTVHSRELRSADVLVAANGVPVEGALVVLEADGNVVHSALTDASGHASIWSDWEGEHTLRVISSDHLITSGVAAAYGDTIHVELESPITRLEGQVVHIVTGEPMPGVTVFAFDADGNLVGLEDTDPAGRFAFRSLPATVVRLQVEASGYAVAEGGLINLATQSTVTDARLDLVPSVVSVTTPADSMGGQAAEGESLAAIGLYKTWYRDYFAKLRKLPTPELPQDAECEEQAAARQEIQRQQEVLDRLWGEVERSKFVYDTYVEGALLDVGADILWFGAELAWWLLASRFKVNSATKNVAFTPEGRAAIRLAFDKMVDSLKLGYSVIREFKSGSKSSESVVSITSDAIGGLSESVSTIHEAQSIASGEAAAGGKAGARAAAKAKALGNLLNSVSFVIDAINIFEKLNRHAMEVGRLHGQLTGNAQIYVDSHRALSDFVNKLADIKCEDDDEGDEEDEGRGQNVVSITPEDKFGPVGYDVPGLETGSEQRFVQPGQLMEYRIDFWNDEDAEVPTQDAVIFDWLDPSVFDVSTFEFTRVGFLDWDLPLPGTQTIDVRIDARPALNFAVDVRAGWEMQVPRPDGQNSIEDPSGKLVWWFTTVDPDTGDYPDDAMAGFLPPFDPVTMFELGWVEFRVRAWDDLPTGTRVENQAFVQFDFLPNPKTGVEWGPAPPEGPWVNTIDADPPTSRVVDLPQQVARDFVVRWEGEDLGSGVVRYDVFVSKDDEPFTAWLIGTALTEAVFTDAVVGSTYSFYSAATDGVGYREIKFPIAEATTHVVEGDWEETLRLLDSNISVTASRDGNQEVLKTVHLAATIETLIEGTYQVVGQLRDGDHAVLDSRTEWVEFSGQQDLVIDFDVEEVLGLQEWNSPLIVNIQIYDQAGRLLLSSAEDAQLDPHRWNLFLPNPWHNYLQPHDVNGDGSVNPFDVLLIVSELTNITHRDPETGLLPSLSDMTNLPTVYLDVRNDGRVTPFDALMIVSMLLPQSEGEPGQGEGEGEGEGEVFHYDNVWPGASPLLTTKSYRDPAPSWPRFEGSDQQPSLPQKTVADPHRVTRLGNHPFHHWDQPLLDWMARDDSEYQSTEDQRDWVLSRQLEDLDEVLDSISKNR
jgi:hypothetical protein